jgi:hypothetical protein
MSACPSAKLNRSDAAGPSGLHVLPQCAVELPREKGSRARDLTLVFVHNNKAGGTTIKDLLSKLCRHHRWDCIVDPKDAGKEWPGSAVLRSRAESLRVVVGWLGLCERLPHPCIYLTTLREPLDHLMSSWHYFCLRGEEARHMWSDAQRAMGRCDTPLDEWFGVPTVSRLIEPFSAIGSADRAWSAAAQLAVARANLRSPCMWYLLTDRLTAGLAQLGDKLGSPWSGVFNANATAKNVHAESPGTVPQPKLRDATISRARSRVAMAQALFQFATASYDQQWSRPLQVC